VDCIGLLVQDEHRADFHTLAPFDSGGFAACFSCEHGFHGEKGFFCVDTFLDTIPAERAFVRTDSLNRVHVIYKQDRLRYAYTSDGWHFEDLPEELSDWFQSFALDAGLRPVLAFSVATGVFLAIGEPSSIDEAPTYETRSARAVPTFLHGSLRLPEAVSGGRFAVGASLRNAGGRRVLALHPGENDVSRVAPGIYFVRDELQASSLKLQAIRKVILTR
jgi:hypothetical protein